MPVPLTQYDAESLEQLFERLFGRRPWLDKPQPVRPIPAINQRVVMFVRNVFKGKRAYDVTKEADFYYICHLISNGQWAEHKFYLATPAQINQSQPKLSRR